MKKILFILKLCLINTFSFSQIHYSANINFENNSHLVQIDTTNSINLWQIGIPEKSLFDSAYSTPYAIITDTENPYQINNTSSFQVKIIPPPNSCWGIGIMGFNHKYDFESYQDGGFIEIQYDNDTNWTNIIFDEDPELGTNGLNFYTTNDTIIGNIPAFTGTSDEWVYSQFEWAWQIGVKSERHDSLTIRFSINSDANETNQEGWLIDNIYLRLDDCTGNIENGKININSSTVIPNPVTNISNIYFSNQSHRLTIVNIFNNTGKRIKSIETYLTYIEIRNNEFESGIFTYQIIQSNSILGNGKFTIVK